MRLRDSGATDATAGDDIEAAIRAQIALLWQTRPRRDERIRVADEIDSAVATLRDVFVPALPVLYARWERALGSRPPSFLTPAKLIGGDRDDNPNVDADTLQYALARGAEAALGGYLDTLHELGAELSISSTIQPATPEIEALADAIGDVGAARGDEPYRRAIADICARVAATYHALTGRAPARPAVRAGRRMAGRTGC